MRLLVFSVLDAAAGAFLPPFFERSAGAAIRAFQSAVNDEKHTFFKNASDYSLYEIGSFDDADGAIAPKASLVCLATASSLKVTGL
ncbi:MAG: nonstructural protein [Microvirus sp.]|nr:MAG: nonstructural protein [Microvirus sp.]